MKHPYFITWSKQNTTSTFALKAAQDVFLTTAEDKTLIDFSSTSYQASFGHSEPRIIAAIEAQLKKFSIASPKAIFELKQEVSERLIKLIQKGSKLTGGKLLYTTSGAESVENALKIARKVSQKKIILSRETCYHGATLGAMSISGDWRNEAHFTVDEWNVKIPDPDKDPQLEKTKAIIKKIGANNIAAICLETITGGNGVIIPSPKWWQGIQEICREEKIILIVDEIICGLYRTGKSFGFHHYDLTPDIICIAKAITGGMVPFGAVWVNEKISSQFDNEVFACGLTNVGHPLGLAATKGVLDIVENHDFLENLNKLNSVFTDQLQALLKLNIITSIRSKGLIAALDLTQSIAWDKFIENGLYLVSGEKRIILAPPLIMKPKILLEAFKKLTHVLESV